MEPKYLVVDPINYPEGARTVAKELLDAITKGYVILNSVGTGTAVHYIIVKYEERPIGEMLDLIRDNMPREEDLNE